MATPKQLWEQQQLQMQRVKNSGTIVSYNGSPVDDTEEEMSRSALAIFRVKEEEIERKKLEVRDKVQAQLGRAEEATKRLAEIREVSKLQFILLIHVIYCTILRLTYTLF